MFQLSEIQSISLLKHAIRLAVTTIFLTAPWLIAKAQAEPTQPHVVIILADDLGYGDVQPLNPKSEIPTPAFNRLAKEGITFTDAHTPSAVCTPTRYGLLTGRYCWRTALKRGVLNGYGKPLIESDRPTIASIMKTAGYRTNVVGKWHLGLGLVGDETSLDLGSPLTSHPGHLGFDHSFVIPASLDFPPYAYFKNGLATTPEADNQTAVGFPAFTRAGPRAKDFVLRNCLDRLTDEAISVITEMKESTDPTFLYFPLTAPHKPVLPNALFAGTTSYGPYGDFLRQVDHAVGRIITSLEKNKQLDDTILIVTSDNGSFMKEIQAGETDHVEDSTIQGFVTANHRSNAAWRGTKADIWEGGHRVPFFVRLPDRSHAGSRVTQVVGIVDIVRTLSDLLEIDLPANAAPDSHSFAGLLQDPSQVFQRPPLICHSAAGMFAIRAGHWKLVAGTGSGGRESPKGNPFQEPWMLFNLALDPGERNNVADENPEIFKQLSQQLLGLKGND